MSVKDYLVVDIMKPMQSFTDLTAHFQARVADARAYCKLWIKSGHESVDMTGKRIDFYGEDSNATPFHVQDGFVADQPGDDLQMGMGTYYFPDGIFQKEGKWQEAYFKIVGSDGSDISTINLTLNVYASQVEMGVSIKPFIPELQRVEAQVGKAIREMNAQQLLNQIESMKTTVGAYTDLISRNQILNKPDTVNLINSQVAQESAKLDSKLSSLSSQLNGNIRDLGNKLDSSAWHFEQFNGTLINGAGGYAGAQILYNDTVFIARYFGWVGIPTGQAAIDFCADPFGGKMNYEGQTLSQMVMQVRTPCLVQIDHSAGNALATYYVDTSSWSKLASQGSDTQGKNWFDLNMVFTGPRSYWKG